MKDTNYYAKRAMEILNQIKYLTLATVSIDGTPWNSPVAHSIDDNFNFYFGSPKNTQHSQNIRVNGKGFIVIYDSTAPDGEGEGVYMTATVRELDSEEEIKQAISVMFKGDPKIQPHHFLGDSELRAYLVKPIKIWMNDAKEKNGLFHDYRIDIDFSVLEENNRRLDR
jgi:general stress protein 26